MKRTSSLLLAALAASLATSACSKAPGSPASGGGGPVDSGPPPEPGTDLPGLGSASAPTAEAVIGRIRNTLGTDPLAGNFSRAIAQVKPNLPQVANPVQATGLDQIPLLVYAACTDAKLATYGVPTTGTITANSASLVAAGMTMLDAGLAGLASQGPASADFQAALAALVSTLAADKVAAQTMTTSFIAVCMAATTAAVSMVGF